MCNMYNANTLNTSNGCGYSGLFASTSNNGYSNYGCGCGYNSNCLWGTQRICRDCNGNIFVRADSNGCGCSSCSHCCHNHCCCCNCNGNSGNQSDTSNNGNGSSNGNGGFACLTVCGTATNAVFQNATATTNGNGYYTRRCGGRCGRYGRCGCSNWNTI